MTLFFDTSNKFNAWADTINKDNYEDFNKEMQIIICADKESNPNNTGTSFYLQHFLPQSIEHITENWNLKLLGDTILTTDNTFKSVYVEDNAHFVSTVKNIIFGYDNATINANNSIIRLFENARATTRGESRVWAYNTSYIEAKGNTVVDLKDRSFGTFHDRSFGSLNTMTDESIFTYDNSSVELFECGNLKLYGYSKVKIVTDEMHNVGCIDANEYSTVTITYRMDRYYKAISLYNHATAFISYEEAYSMIRDCDFMNTRIIKETTFESDSKADREEFLKSNFTTVEENGRTFVIGYKAVHLAEGEISTFTSDYDSNFEYHVGEVATAECNTDITKMCEEGIHFSTRSFAENYGYQWQDGYMLTVMAPIEEVIVPNETNGKVRAPRVWVLQAEPISYLEKSDPRCTDQIGITAILRKHPVT